MSSKVYEALFQDIDRHMDEYMGELCDFLRIPGVSTYPDGRENMERRQSGFWKSSGRWGLRAVSGRRRAGPLSWRSTRTAPVRPGF